MNNYHLIAWQKWSDPFGSEEDDQKIRDMDIADYDESEQHDDSDYEDNIDTKSKPIKGVKVIATPMGVIPMNDNTMSGKIFNFWIGHTNFDITTDIANIIEKTDGVETLDIFTRYRFRIGVGKVFEDSAVMRNINKRVYKELDHGNEIFN